MTLRTRLRYLLDVNGLAQDQQILIRAQSRMIHEQETKIRSMQLDHCRELQELVIGWLVHTESPEIDMRPELVEFDIDLKHRIAALEEYVL